MNCLSFAEGYNHFMTTRCVYWQADDMWLGYLEEFPDYWTQGTSFDDLRKHLKDLFSELSSGAIPHVRRVAELELG